MSFLRFDFHIFLHKHQEHGPDDMGGIVNDAASFCDKRTVALISQKPLSTPERFCSFSPNRECRKMAGKGVQPLNNYTCRFRPSILKQADKSGLDGLQADK
ncbi:MAG: hypothetical protein K2N78_05105 [Oscillospiraceae bacterium]|nr:hypothetical protein [Oscillospiraceae bacterium]